MFGTYFQILLRKRCVSFSPLLIYSRAPCHRILIHTGEYKANNNLANLLSKTLSDGLTLNFYRFISDCYIGIFIRNIIFSFPFLALKNNDHSCYMGKLGNTNMRESAIWILGSIIVMKPLWQEWDNFIQWQPAANISIPDACLHLKQRPLVPKLHLSSSLLIPAPAVVDRLWKLRLFSPCQTLATGTCSCLSLLGLLQHRSLLAGWHWAAQRCMNGEGIHIRGKLEPRGDGSQWKMFHLPIFWVISSGRHSQNFWQNPTLAASSRDLNDVPCNGLPPSVFCLFPPWLLFLWISFQINQL